ncbi:hypothetical protein DVP60_21005 [Yersinia enterocolitica]|uniref:ABC-three component system middle component 1 n=1 Tax=Yersinia TaxID=629 RepID=UPI0021E8788D|nr:MULTISPECIES: ABC-three component system middle component 1 [Yersinia]EKN3949045.1 hypothetical protein [Yersinia enterocolitica]EKN6318693.1 hypothetical protein [Yersinia enterocolitica]MDA5544385.1 hypothetical protein [Yersinia rochesterensis]UYJ98516.1 hypothetical protein N4W06_05480 [Yersinia enterocolitica]UZM74047.1 hypothetical protein OP863_13905 [Yersinia sp. SCPM-O-B-9106 (C-191)]
MNLTSANNDRIRELKENFPNFAFDLFTAGNSEFVSCIACWVESPEVLEHTWNAIQNVVALRYKSERKIARWNVYIAFFCREHVSRSLKLLIENDKFTARKLVFDSCSENHFWKKKEFALERLNYEIFEVNLTVGQSFGLKVEYTPSSLVSYLRNYSAATAEGKLEMIDTLLMEHGIHENKES